MMKRKIELPQALTFRKEDFVEDHLGQWDERQYGDPMDCPGFRALNRYFYPFKVFSVTSIYFRLGEECIDTRSINFATVREVARRLFRKDKKTVSVTIPMKYI